jgi:uncharacterized Zn finger protein
MKARSPILFDIDALRNLVGATVFARGERYHRDGHAQILSVEPGRVLAQVTGSEDYRTELTVRGKQIGGQCSCPAFEDWGFCKHMVAAALAANDAPTEDGGALSRIRDHLKTKSVDTLVAMILNLAERDPALFRKLDTASISLRADDKTLEARLRKAIDSATRTGDFIDYREASGWASGVDAALDALADVASGAQAPLALKLAERAIERIERAAESIDDSDGHCGTLLQRARDIHLAAARAARPEPLQLARDLYAREMEQDFGAFDGAAALYEDALGEKGLAEYRRLAAEAWDKLPARSAGRRENHEFNYDYNRLRDILDFFAGRDGDVEARVALRAKDLSSPWSYLQLAEFCRSQGRKEEALRRAEEGLWLFEDRSPDERLVLFTAELLAEAGRGADAEACLWRAFEKTPSRALYDQLCKLGGNARERSLKSLESRLAKTTGPLGSSLADLLIEILMREKMYDAAWASARKYRVSGVMKNALAEASEKNYPVEALRVYAERVEQLVDGGGNSGYTQAAALIARMSKLRSAAEQTAYVAVLRERFGRKRNFMKLIE